MIDYYSKELGPAEIIVKVERLGLQNATGRDLYHYADALRLVGRRREALQIYKSLERKGIPKGKEWLVRLFLGKTYSDMGRFKEAERAYLISAQLNSGSTVTWVHLACALGKQEKFEEAVSVLEKATSLPGDPDEVLLNLGLYLRAMGRLDEAVSRLQEALSISPDYAEALEALRDVEQALLA